MRNTKHSLHISTPNIVYTFRETNVNPPALLGGGRNYFRLYFEFEIGARQAVSFDAKSKFLVRSWLATKPTKGICMIIAILHYQGNGKADVSCW
jgi:hypothetical protein